MRSIAFAIVFLACSAIAAQSSQQTIRKKTDTLYSGILKEKRIVWVHVPPGSSVNSQSSSNYPVIYVLDAEAHFNTLIEDVTKSGLLNKVIVVGIGNIWSRYRDYSPTHINSSPYVDSFTAKTTGGGEKFIAFVEKELIPYINSSYPVSPTRSLIGHSMGGLIVMDILLKHSKLFNYYAALDPSMWWDNQQLLKQAQTILSTKQFDGIALFLAAANTTNRELTFEQLKNDKSDKSVLIRPTLTLADYINANKQNKLKFDWKYYNNENHMSVFAPAAYDALQFISGFLKHH